MQTPAPALSTELQTRLVSVLDYLGEAVKSGADFASQQAPAVAREVVLYGAIVNWAGVVVMLAFVLVCVRALAWIVKEEKADRAKHEEQQKDERYKSDFDPFGHAVIGFLCIAVAVGCMCNAIFSFAPRAAKATWAPRVYLIEWTADKLK